MNTTMAIRIHGLGGPEMLRWEEVAIPDPGPGEVLVRHEAVGLNFIDTYHRSGLYPVPSLPTAIGMEGAGVVEEVGPPGGAGPTFQPGDRVAYGFGLGAYCERRVMPVGQLVPIPDGVDSETAAAAMLKGMTSWYLCRRTYRLSEGETVLVHAAAGGVGTILSQWCKAAGRHRHRDRGQRREGGGGARARLRPRHPLQGRGLRRTGARDHRGRGRPRGLRRGRQGHLRRLDGVPRPLRHDDHLRQRLGRGAPAQSPAPERQGAQRGASVAQAVYRAAGRPGRGRRRAPRAHSGRAHSAHGGAAVSACGGGGGASRAGVAADAGVHGAAAQGTGAPG